MNYDSIEILPIEENEFTVSPSIRKKNPIKYFIIGGVFLCLLMCGGLVFGLLYAAKRTPPVETIPSIPTIVEVEQNEQAKKKKKRQVEKPALNRQEVIQKSAPEKQRSIRPVFGLTHQDRAAQQTEINTDGETNEKEAIDTMAVKTIAQARQEKRKSYASSNARYKSSQKTKKNKSFKPTKSSSANQLDSEKQPIPQRETQVDTVDEKPTLADFNFSVTQTSIDDGVGQSNKEFIKAKLNERITLKGNKPQKISLRLSEKATINGTSFSAGSLCYGRAYLQKEKIQIYVYSIIDSKQGNKLDNTELVVCGSDRNEGIFVGKPTLQGNEIGQALGSMIADATPGRLGDRTVRRTMRQAKIGSGRTLEKGRLVLIRM